MEDEASFEEIVKGLLQTLSIKDDVIEAFRKNGDKNITCCVKCIQCHNNLTFIVDNTPENAKMSLVLLMLYKSIEEVQPDYFEQVDYVHDDCFVYQNVLEYRNCNNCQVNSNLVNLNKRNEEKGNVRDTLAPNR